MPVPALKPDRHRAHVSNDVLTLRARRLLNTLYALPFVFQDFLARRYHCLDLFAHTLLTRVNSIMKLINRLEQGDEVVLTRI